MKIGLLRAVPAFLCATAAYSQPCNLTWQVIGPSSQYYISGSALIEHDVDGDGPMGPVLVSAGFNINIPRWWDGAAWQQIQGSAEGLQIYQCNALEAASFDFDGPGGEPESLVMVGLFSTGVAPQLTVVRWNGESWIALLTTTQSTLVGAITTFDMDEEGETPSQLFVSGLQFNVPSGSHSGVVRWNGIEWVGTGFPSNWTSSNFSGGQFTTFDFDGPGPLPEELVVSGGFRLRVGLRPGGVARWHDGVWTFDGVGIPQFNTGEFIDALVTYDFDGDGPLPPRLVASGVRGVPEQAWIAYLDGATWVPFAPPISQSTGIYDLEVFDADGNGPEPAQLYAAGESTMHRYVGNHWEPMTTPPVLTSGYKMLPTVWNGSPSLVIGGSRPIPGANYTIAVLRGCALDCTADFDGNGSVDLDDLAMLLSNFGSDEASTDLDGDDATSLTDLAMLLVEFGTNCPTP